MLQRMQWARPRLLGAAVSLAVPRAAGLGLDPAPFCADGKWCLGAFQATCDDVCWSHGMYCTADLTGWIPNGQWPQTEAEMRQIKDDAGIICDTYEMSTISQTAPEVSNVQNTPGDNKCFVQSSTADCDRCGMTGPKNRLCPCTTSPKNDPKCATQGPARIPTHSPRSPPSVSPVAGGAGPAPSPAPSAGPSERPSAGPSASPQQPSASPVQPTAGPSGLPTLPPSVPPTLSPVRSPSVAPSAVPVRGPSAAPSAAPSLPPQMPTAAPSGAPTGAPARGPSRSPSASPLSPSASPTGGPTQPPAQPTRSPVVSPSRGPSTAPSESPVGGPTESPAPPSASPTTAPSEPPTQPPADPTRSPVVPPSRSPSSAPSASPVGGPTASPAPPSVSPTTAPSGSPTQSPALPTLSPVVGPSQSPSVSPTTSPVGGPSASPALPSTSPTAAPVVSPTASPTESPVAGPTTAPTVAPSRNPVGGPSASPVVPPTRAPTEAPTAGPSPAPSAPPLRPSAPPSDAPSAAPSGRPTVSPTHPPMIGPTVAPSVSPSMSPTRTPTKSPVVSPTASPSAGPSTGPSPVPSTGPTAQPSTAAPTGAPSTPPSLPPEQAPTVAPSTVPSPPPSAPPQPLPSAPPSVRPTWGPLSAPPSASPSSGPTASPWAGPSGAPSAAPSRAPVRGPSASPTATPTAGPKVVPTAPPSASPSDPPATIAPSGAPSAPPEPAPSVSPSRAAAAPTAPPSAAPTASPTIFKLTGLTKSEKEVVEQSTKVAAAATAVTGSPGAGRLAVIMNLDCSIEDVDLGAEPLDFEFHPVGVGIGTNDNKYFKGAILFNALLVLGVGAVFGLLALAQVQICQTPVLKAMGNVKCPGMAFVPYMFLLQGTSLAACNLGFRPLYAMEGLYGWCILLICVASPGLLWWLLLREKRFWAQVAEDPRLDAEAGIEQYKETGQSPPRVLEGWQRQVYVAFFGPRIWVSKENSPHFCERYGVIFESYKEGRIWFVLCEIGQILAVSILSVWRPDGPTACHLRNAIMSFVLFALWAAQMWFRPYLSRVDHVLQGLLNFMSFLAVLLMTIALASSESTGEGLMAVAAQLLFWSAILLMFKVVYDFALFAMDMRVGRRSGTRQRMARVEWAKDKDHRGIFELPVVEVDALGEDAEAQHDETMGRGLLEGSLGQSLAGSVAFTDMNRSVASDGLRRSRGASARPRHQSPEQLTLQLPPASGLPSRRAQGGTASAKHPHPRPPTYNFPASPTVHSSRGLHSDRVNSGSLHEGKPFYMPVAHVGTPVQPRKRRSMSHTYGDDSPDGRRRQLSLREQLDVPTIPVSPRSQGRRSTRSPDVSSPTRSTRPHRLSGGPTTQGPPTPSSRGPPRRRGSRQRFTTEIPTNRDMPNRASTTQRVSPTEIGSGHLTVRLTAGTRERI
eukprot:TRINITY_DN60807_c0_g1_i1.p1 TRINITY_DN60807_c0_g1~~TRINITY_DN60807_c0_g1_i1.p1  ORF type:complete len:1414 (+),score=159.63 TRINITY_DN60807_c0_g1_i1:70-4311(+)